MKDRNWWRELYNKMPTAREKFEYLTGLSGLSWEDCCDAWLEAKNMIPEVAKELAAKDAEIAVLREQFMLKELEWDMARNELKAKLKDCVETLEEIRRADFMYCDHSGGTIDGPFAKLARACLSRLQASGEEKKE